MLFGGDIVNDTYSIVEEIGSGGMGVVYLAITSDWKNMLL